MTPHRLTTLAVAGVLCAPAFSASAELRYDNNSGGDVLLYGQFNPAYLSFDDGVSTTSEFVDSAHSNSRVGLWVTQPMGTNVFRFNFETALGVRQSSSVSQTFTPQLVDWTRTAIRKVDFSLQTEKAGKFYLGQGSMATDGIADGDFSETGLTLYNSIGDTAGGFFFRTTAGVLSGNTVGQATPNFDGGRRARVRYDTPVFGGFTFAVAAGQEVLSYSNSNDYYDASLRYENEINGTQIKGGIGYSVTSPSSGAADLKYTMGSLSLLFQSGINFVVAAGTEQNAGNYGYTKLGYVGNWLAVGDTKIAIDYYDGSDTTSVGSKAKSTGIGLVQDFDQQNISAYLGYRTYALDETSASYMDASSIFFGARWQY